MEERTYGRSDLSDVITIKISRTDVFTKISAMGLLAELRYNETYPVRQFG